MQRTLVLGLGNDLLADDGVGLRIVEELRQRPALAGFEFQTAATAGLDVGRQYSIRIWALTS